MSLFHLSLVAVSSLVDLAALLAALFVARSRPLNFPRLAMALFATAAFAALKLPPLCALAGSMFFAVALGLADLMFVAPLAATIVLALRTEATRTVRVLACSAVVLLPAAGIYATIVEPNRLVEERVDVVIDGPGAPREPLRIAVLADIQSRAVDERLREAVRRAMAFEPHLIVLPGDLIQLEDEREYLRVVPQFRELLQPLSAPLGVYFTLGNTDSARLVARVFEGTNVRLLANEAVEVEHAGQRVLVGGGGMSFDSVSTRTFLQRFERRESDELRILVSHFPDVVFGLGPGRGVDLVVAGHTHGGQVQLPFIGPPITLSDVPRSAAAGGLHEVAGQLLYVSRGIGAERGAAPQIRWNCPPEVSLLTLRGVAAE